MTIGKSYCKNQGHRCGAHSQGETLDELNHNLKEVVELLLEDGEPELETEFVGTQSVVVA